MMRTGASCDWTRERFTLDEGLSRAVREVFVRLYEKGLIYRGQYMVNWCPRCHTALSDLETVHDQTPGNLWHIRYPVMGTERYLVVATTRPETMLGDTGVAINAKDARYLDLHGKTVMLPLMDREIPIILDDLADPEFGTGVVKVTPSHDPNDFEAGRRHNLAQIKVIDENAVMTQAAGPYAGLDRFEARKRVVADLETLGLLAKIEPYDVSLGKCQRCKTVVEPLVSIQWFVKTKPLAEPAIRAVEDGRIQFIPENWTKVYYEWMHNIRDWCISRQLWWGHRIPAWYCQECGEIVVSRETPERCTKCGSARLEQDPDVLDTWFSSGLWPFSTMGWPEESADLKKYYPTSLLITGFDILFFWVARMIMLGLECRGEVPFRQVYIHGLVRDAEKQKMSKTRGNTIDPLELTEKYGTDAVRMALVQGAAPGTDIVLTEERIESARAFANKIWNASRFIFLNMERSEVEVWLPEKFELTANAPIEDRWIFSRLTACAQAVNKALGAYRYHEAAQNLWEFFWHEFCDWYLELKKLRLQEASGLNDDWRNLLTVYEAALRLLHPVMPFITEELWQRLEPAKYGRPASIALCAYPELAGTDAEAEEEIARVQRIITEARNLRAENKVDPRQKIGVLVETRGELLDSARQHSAVIEKLAAVQMELAEAPESAVSFQIKLKAQPGQLEAQRKRLEKEIEQLDKVLTNSERQLGNQEFLGRAPAQVVESMRQKQAEYRTQLANKQAALESLDRA
jgi:valyl-tRNA synthetase